MIRCSTVQKEAIRSHYDLATLFYRLLWGPHIHHGLWQSTESPAVAQRQLTETVAREARIRGGETVLDVGCGMGSSSIHLAKTFGCRVTGITLSPLQQRWASLSSYWHRVRGKTEFLCLDAEQAEFPTESFDVVWSIECTEHLFDKQAFFRKAAHWLHRGGRVAICAWLADEELQSAEARRQVHDVCEGFFCPSLGTAQEYRTWMQEAGLTVDCCYDWTERVARTWEICTRRARRTGMPWLARLINRETVTFLERFETILRAYRTGAMRYGCFVARKD